MNKTGLSSYLNILLTILLMAQVGLLAATMVLGVPHFMTNYIAFFALILCYGILKKGADDGANEMPQ